MKTLKLFVSTIKNRYKFRDKVKTYYYKDDSGKEVLIGNQEAMDKFHIGKEPDECHITPYSRWTRAKERNWEELTLVIDGWDPDDVQRNIDHIVRNMDGDEYKFRIDNYTQCT